jgi:Putative transposase/Transposase zinc-binding domain
MKTALSMAEVFQRFLADYKTRYPLSPEQSKVIGSINCCRTEALGGRSLSCNHCHYQRQQFHSCRNRHCPQCQHQATDEWRQKQADNILPVPYFHVVFTLPHELNGWAQLHPDVIYRLLFKAVWSTLKSFGDDEKRLDGQLGMTAVLHTWSQNMGRHIHLHCLIPGGALSKDEQQWRTAGKGSYLFPVRALSRCYRGKMVSLLRQAWETEQLHRLASKAHVDKVLNQLMTKPWVVYTRYTGEHAEAVVTYLSRYTYRIAISEQRLVAMDDRKVMFRWKDYAANGVKKVMPLDGVEFIRRFLMHVLPNGFMRIRHYGFLANCHRKTKLALIKTLLPFTSSADTLSDSGQIMSVAQVFNRLSHCPACRCGTLRVIAKIKPGYRRRQS